jgi:diadenosine tetraphosphate (Ap4A) HIT family hydrolase
MKKDASKDRCPFCDFILNQEPIAQNGTFFAKQDEYPVSPGHTLLIPVRHVETFFELNKEEREDFFSLLLEMHSILQHQYEPDGFNIGINIGPAAGQTIAHLHIHLIPRYLGDVKNPVGGVRGVIPERADYTSEMW